MPSFNEDLLTHGVLVNNPGNIRVNPNSKWLGEVDNPGQTFCAFSSPVFGIRAMLVLIRTYILSETLTTVEAIISRYAPPSENDTSAYIKDVCITGGFTPTTQIDNPAKQAKLVFGMILHENGFAPYTMDFISRVLSRFDAGVGHLTQETS